MIKKKKEKKGLIGINIKMTRVVSTKNYSKQASRPWIRFDRQLPQEGVLVGNPFRLSFSDKFPLFDWLCALYALFLSNHPSNWQSSNQQGYYRGLQYYIIWISDGISFWQVPALYEI